MDSSLRRFDLEVHGGNLWLGTRLHTQHLGHCPCPKRRFMDNGRDRSPRPMADNHRVMVRSDGQIRAVSSGSRRALLPPLMTTGSLIMD